MKKNILINIYVTIFSLCVCFLFSEIAIRIFFQYEINKERLEMGLRGNEGAKKLVRPSPDPEIFYELIPDLNTSFLDKSIRTNAEGLRVGASNEDKNLPDDKKIRIAGIGDSTMFGWGVEQEDTYLHMLEESLNNSNTGHKFQSFNFAVPGYNSEQEFAVLCKKALKMKPHILMLHYDHNDADPIGVLYKPDYIAPEVGDNFLHSAFIKWIIRRVRYAANKNKIYPKGKHQYFQDNLFEGPVYDRHLIALKKIASIAEKNNILLYTIIYDTGIERVQDRNQDPHYLILHKKLIYFLRKFGYNALDSYNVLQKFMEENGLKDLKSLWINNVYPWPDRHPNKEGHKIIAKALYSRIFHDPKFREMIGR